MPRGINWTLVAWTLVGAASSYMGFSRRWCLGFTAEGVLGDAFAPCQAQLRCRSVTITSGGSGSSLATSTFTAAPGRHPGVTMGRGGRCGGIAAHFRAAVASASNVTGLLR